MSGADLGMTGSSARRAETVSGSEHRRFQTHEGFQLWSGDFSQARVVCWAMEDRKVQVDDGHIGTCETSQDEIP